MSPSRGKEAEAVLDAVFYFEISLCRDCVIILFETLAPYSKYTCFYVVTLQIMYDL